MPYPVFTHGRRDRPTIALTFDDGPNPPCTEEVLAILASRNVPASFFVIGQWVERFPETVRRILAAGHVVGNHTHTHTADADYERAEDLLASQCGRPSRFLRAPSLGFQHCRKSPLALSSAVKLVSGDSVPCDWLGDAPERLLARILDDPRLTNGSILLLHDGSHLDADRLTRPRAMIQILPAVIDSLMARGYSLVGLDALELADPEMWPDG